MIQTAPTVRTGGAARKELDNHTDAMSGQQRLKQPPQQHNNNTTTTTTTLTTTITINNVVGGVAFSGGWTVGGADV